ncbi:J domain-containing protein [Erythrobacteraceae bacterium CFH 75059]|uniref:J domain-containing protein n=1 Tax=Qipengyuania thermophila TaxID=2509361 RepID=UPI0010219A17|nr:J domain-containing protein [Qipengyuania thermophila]TCD04931.1 J domain-containing protein [Erythrobacteraceae bacterium CFH 75059]
MTRDKFHGRHERKGRVCEDPGCDQPGEFRAPSARGSSSDGPGAYHWYCLDHVRAFNQRYDWFAGMSAEEIMAAQSPVYGWRTESIGSPAAAMAGDMPRWADFRDPLDAIEARARGMRMRAAGMAAAGTGGRFTPDEVSALATLGLNAETDLPALRRRYSELVRRYHPDRNGGDRRHEDRLRRVLDAYQLLRASTAFAS